MTTAWSRRDFLIASAGIPAIGFTHPQTPAASLTAGQVIDRIKASVGVPWRAQTVDNIIAGTADSPVRGIATTMMATAAGTGSGSGRFPRRPTA